MFEWIKAKKKAIIISILVAAAVAATGAPPVAMEAVVTAIYNAVDGTPSAQAAQQK